MEFQSTHPARGATPLRSQGPGMWSRFQSTHPARGATQRQSTNGKEQYISIHAPREGCDSTGMAFLEGELEFQSTHPARGATLRNSV